MRSIRLYMPLLALTAGVYNTACLAQTVSPTATANPTATSNVTLAVADLDIYQRGLQLEIDMLRSVQARLLLAREAHDNVAEIAALQPVITRQYERNAAKALGVDLHRYRDVKSRFGDILVLSEYIDQLNAQLEQLHQTGSSAKQQASQRKEIESMLAKAVNPYAVLDNALRNALKAQADALMRLRIDDRDLVQELTSR